MTIAKNAPTTGIHIGADTGRQNAISIPVTTAERSPIDDGFFIKYLYSHSNAIHDATEIIVSTRERHPKKYTAIISGNKSAIMTSAIIDRVSSSVLI